MATLVRWQPWNELAGLHTEMSRLMNGLFEGNGRTTQAWVPALDMWETENEFVFAFTFLDDQSKYTLPIMLQYFFGRSGNEWGPIMAASTLLTVPVIAFFLVVQRKMVSGLTAGAVKG